MGAVGEILTAAVCSEGPHIGTAHITVGTTGSRACRSGWVGRSNRGISTVTILRLVSLVSIVTNDIT